MLQLVIIVIAFVGLAIASRLAWSGSAKEKRYMARHRRLMETMSKLSDAAPEQFDPPKFKVEPLRPPRLDLSRLDDLTDPDLIRIEAPLGGGSEHHAEAEPPTKEAPLDETARIERSLFASELVFGEDETLAGVPADATEVLAPAAEPAGAGGTGRRIYRSGGRSVPLSVMAVGLGAVAVLVGVGFFVLSGGTHASAPTSAQHPGSTQPSSRSQTRSTTGPGTKKSGTKKSGTKKSGAKKKATSQATPTVLNPTQTTAQSATFEVPGGVKTVVVSATAAPCWVADSATPNGPILWDQTLAAGTSYAIHSNSSSLWIRVGNSHDFAMTVNGLPAHFSSPPGPFNFDLVGS